MLVSFLMFPSSASYATAKDAMDFLDARRMPPGLSALGRRYIGYFSQRFSVTVLEGAALGPSAQVGAVGRSDAPQPIGPCCPMEPLRGAANRVTASPPVTAVTP